MNTLYSIICIRIQNITWHQKPRGCQGSQRWWLPRSSARKTWDPQTFNYNLQHPTFDNVLSQRPTSVMWQLLITMSMKSQPYCRCLLLKLLWAQLTGDDIVRCYYVIRFKRFQLYLIMDMKLERGAMQTNKQSKVFTNYRHSERKQRSPEENSQELDLVAALVENQAHEA